MIAFLSDAWIEAMDRAATADETLGALVEGVELVLQQEVVDVPGGDVTYVVRISDGTVRVRKGPAGDAAVRFHQDHRTAVDIASGRLSAQRAFMTGRLQVGGDLKPLIERGDVLGALHDVFASVRADTEGLGVPEAT